MKVHHDLFPDESAAADNHDLHACPLFRGPQFGCLMLERVGDDQRSRGVTPRTHYFDPFEFPRRYSFSGSGMTTCFASRECTMTPRMRVLPFAPSGLLVTRCRHPVGS